MAEFASNGKANAGLATGIVGTSLSGLLALGSGLLGNGMLGWNNRASVCNEDHFVNRYELDKDQQISRLETEKSLLQAEKHTDEKSLELYRYVDGRFREFERRLLEKGVESEHISLLPPDTAYAQIINVSDYNLTENVTLADFTENQRQNSAPKELSADE